MSQSRMPSDLRILRHFFQVVPDATCNHQPADRVALRPVKQLRETRFGSVRPVGEKPGNGL
jgi:hypothetical protein